MREINLIEIRPSAVARVLGAAAILLVILHVLANVGAFVFGYPSAKALVALFSLDVQSSIPNFFSMFLLLSSALLLFHIAVLKRKQEDPDVRMWALLAFVLLLLAVDEYGSYHVPLLGPMREFLEGENLGFLYWALVLAGIVFVLVFVLLYLRFLWRLPKRTRWTFVLAAVLIVGGAVGIKMAGGYYLDLHGWQDMDHAWITTVEEGLEMSGAILFIYALLEYIGTNYGEVRMRIYGAERDCQSKSVEKLEG